MKFELIRTFLSAKEMLVGWAPICGPWTRQVTLGSTENRALRLFFAKPVLQTKALGKQALVPQLLGCCGPQSIKLGITALEFNGLIDGL
jgi:hypothetical protein